MCVECLPNTVEMFILRSFNNFLEMIIFESDICLKYKFLLSLVKNNVHFVTPVKWSLFHELLQEIGLSSVMRSSDTKCIVNPQLGPK